MARRRRQRAGEIFGYPCSCRCTPCKKGHHIFCNFRCHACKPIEPPEPDEMPLLELNYRKPIQPPRKPIRANGETKCIYCLNGLAEGVDGGWVVCYNCNGSGVVKG